MFSLEVVYVWSSSCKAKWCKKNYSEFSCTGVSYTYIFCPVNGTNGDPNTCSCVYVCEHVYTYTCMCKHTYKNIHFHLAIAKFCVSTYVFQHRLCKILADICGNVFSVLTATVSLCRQLSGQTTLWVLVSICNSVPCRVAGRYQDVWYRVSGEKFCRHLPRRLTRCLGLFSVCMLSLKTGRATPELHIVMPTEYLISCLRLRVITTTNDKHLR